MERVMKNPDAVGELRIGSSLTIGTCLLPKYTKNLALRYPNIKQRVSIDNSDNIVKAVAEGQIDIGLVEGAVNDKLLFAKAFMDDHLVAVCGRSHPFAQSQVVSLDEFLSQPLLLRERGSGTRELFESAVTLLEKQVNPVWESISTTALIYAVEAGNGVSVLPEKLVVEYIAAGRLREVKLQTPVLCRSLYLIHHKKKYLSASIRSFINIVMNQLN
ncbi:MAG: LysR substrate-binding domain-containing protein [Actinomycetota bacterium]|nr:LysR substrate-binding domain-containing protein [Actinomycetota bacterium]